MPWGMWIAFVGGVLACVGLAVGAAELGTYSVRQLVDYNSPYVSGQVPAGLASTVPTPGAAMTQRVVLVIVDGLRDDVSRSSMPTLSRLRNYGSDFTLNAPQPTLNFPGWTTVLTGASPTISGVTTDLHTTRELAPTLVDTARAAGEQVVVVGPTDFGSLFGIAPGPGVSLRAWPKGGYLSATFVDDALRLSKEASASLVVVHLPDLDVAGRASGGSSAHYRDVAARIDADISRLVAGLQGDGTTFVVTADHGQADTGGDGGAEPTVVRVPAVLAGAGIRLSSGSGDLGQVAPTVSALLGLPDPAYAEDTALFGVYSTGSDATYASDVAHHVAFSIHDVSVVRGIEPAKQQIVDEGGPDVAAALARDGRLTAERGDRLMRFLVALLAIAIVLIIIALMSWRAFVAGLAGTLAYYAVFEALFFWVHRYSWSLSAMNGDVVRFASWRLGEAAAAALVGVAAAASVYPLLRDRPKGPQDARFLPGYLALAPSTLMLILGTLGAQVAWFLWQWGAAVVWILPDLMWGFKYGLDLVQMTAVGFTVVLAPLVAYAVGRYHPKVRRHDA